MVYSPTKSYLHTLGYMQSGLAFPQEKGNLHRLQMAPRYGYVRLGQTLQSGGALWQFFILWIHSTSQQSSGRYHGHWSLGTGTWYKPLELVPFGLTLNGRSKWIQLVKQGGMTGGLRTAPWGWLGRQSQGKRLCKWLSVPSWYLGGVLPFHTNEATQTDSGSNAVVMCSPLVLAQ